MTADDAARDVAHRVALARHLEERPALARARPPRARRTRGSRSPRTRPPSASVPRLGALAHRQGGELGAALAHPGRGAQRAARRARPRDGPPSPGTPRRAAVTAASTSAAPAIGASATTRPGSPGSVEHELVAVAPVVADPHRHAHRQAGVDCSRPAREPGALARAAQLERPARCRTAAGRGRRRSSRRGQQLLERPPASPARGGSPRCSCSPAAGGRGTPCRPRGRRPGSRRARAARGPRGRPGGRRRGRAGPAARGRRRRRPWRGWRRRRGDRAQVVRGDGHPHAGAGGPRLSSATRQRLEVAVGLGLVLEDRRAPAVLAGERRPRGPSRRP